MELETACQLLGGSSINEGFRVQHLGVQTPICNGLYDNVLRGLFFSYEKIRYVDLRLFYASFHSF